MSIYDAAMRYAEESTPLIVIAGKEYGTGSSRDWAAKGTLLLGVKAVLVESFERIHRSNLVGMGVLPLQFLPGENAASLGLTGEETFDIAGVESLSPRQKVKVKATKADGSITEFDAIVRIDSPVEVEYYRNGGILQTVLRRLQRIGSVEHSTIVKRSHQGARMGVPRDADTVVIGGGTAGAVVAGLLAERSDERVLVLEAGPDFGRFDGGRWPAALLDARALGYTHDWGYASGEYVPRSDRQVRAGQSHRRLLVAQRLRRDLGQSRRLRRLGQSWPQTAGRPNELLPLFRTCRGTAARPALRRRGDHAVPAGLSSGRARRWRCLD